MNFESANKLQIRISNLRFKSAKKFKSSFQIHISNPQINFKSSFQICVSNLHFINPHFKV